MRIVLAGCVRSSSGPENYNRSSMVSGSIPASLAQLNYGVVLCVLSSSAPVLLDDVLADCVEEILVPSHGISIMS